MQDLTRDVLRIDAIPATSLDSVREWLQSMDIKFYENKMNLNWKPILKSILEDPEGFIGEGGWDFLDADGDSEGEGEDDGVYSVKSKRASKLQFPGSHVHVVSKAGTFWMRWAIPRARARTMVRAIHTTLTFQADIKKAWNVGLATRFLGGRGFGGPGTRCAAFTG